VGEISSIVGMIAFFATIVAVVIAGRQIFLMKQQEKNGYEHSFNAQYRDIISRLPAEVLLGQSISTVETKRALGAFVAYFDLCNEQIWLHHQLGLISHASWVEWEEGIVSQLATPAFRAAWKLMDQNKPNVYRELREFILHNALQVAKK
jgi:hypothetical protein